MKPLIIICLIVIIPWFYSCGSGKKVVKSQKEIPKWVSTIERGYIIGEGEGPSFGIAKDNALKAVTMKITKTIAQKASSSIKIITSNYYKDNKIVSSENYNRKDVVKTFAPILNGVSILKVDAYYWTKSHTSEGEKIRYFIKYPISEAELDKEIKKWKLKYDKTITEIEEILNHENKYRKVENIIYDYQILDSYLDFGDEFIINRINNRKSFLTTLLKRVEITILDNNQAKLRFCYSLDGTIISYSIGPEIKTNNIIDYSISKDNNIWTLKYNPTVQNMDLDYSVLIESKVNGRELHKYAQLKVIDGSIDIDLLSPILIHETNYWFASDETHFKIKLRSNNNNPFAINYIQLIPTEYYQNFWSGQLESNKLEALNINYENNNINREGIYNLEGKCDYTLPSWENMLSGREAYFTGKVEVTSKVDNKKYIISFNNLNVNIY